MLYGIPFLIASTVLALFFLQYPQKTGYVYGGNLLGSGSGVFMALAIMYGIPPERYLAVAAIAAALGGFFWGMRYQSTGRKISVIVCFIILILVQYPLYPPSLIAALSEYKGLSGLLRLPNATITHRLYSPLGLIHIIEGASIRLATGLNIAFKGALPPQRALTIDGDSPVPVVDFHGDFRNLGFLDEQIYAAGYHLIRNPKVLIIGVGGGTDLLSARYHNSSSIVVLEMNPQIIRAVRDVLGASFYHLYREPPVRLVLTEARGYLEETREKFDLIQLNPTGSFTASASGVYAQNEDYLHTIEAYHTFYGRLSPQGILMVSRWVKTPARDGIKLFATGFQALQKLGVEQPERQLAMIRNWDTTMLLVKRYPFTEKELQSLRAFCGRRNFDVSYLPGIQESEVNQFNTLQPEPYYHSAESIINPLTREQFFATYPFQVKPATDDKPYFSNFSRWAAVPHLIKTLGREWIPFAEFGYVALLATCVQAVLIGGLLILLPMGIVLKRTQAPETSFNARAWFYFIALGFSYMLLEMALIQKFILFLHHPIYSISVVIASFLLVSGLGSLVSQRLVQKGIRCQIIPFIAILILGILYTFTLDHLFAQFGWAHMYVRLGIAFFIIAPLAFFMGMPFPFGMQRATAVGEKGIGGAWGYNGFFSVMGAVATPILAGIMGFKLVGIIGCLGYLLAMALWGSRWR